jgi:surface antigen
MNPLTFVPSPPAVIALDARARRVLARLALVLLIALPCIALAAPPAWAPAHGWRRQHDPAYAGYSGRQWERDYGVSLGRCDRAAVGAVLGGAAGGVIGSQVGEGGQRGVATVIGAVIGATVGAEIGRRMDQADRSCVGHALELAEPGQTISWTNHNTGVAYQLTPADEARDAGDGCRRFRLIATGAFGLSEGRTVACPAPDGTWTLSPEARLGRR